MAIENDKVVSIFYTLKDAKTQETMDSNVGAEPLAFLVGRGQIIPGLEEEIKNLAQNDKKAITVAAKDGYGEYNDEALQTLPKEQFAGIELTQGMTLFGQGEQGESVQVTVKEFTDSEVTVDFNHPLAGKDLLFDVEVAEVRDATDDELAQGFVAPAGGCGCGSCGCEDGEADSCGCEEGGNGGSCGCH